MAVLQINNIHKSFSGETLLKNLSFSIDEKDKIGLVGLNGAGKTTLVKILLEEEHHDTDEETKIQGTISKKGGLKIGYLSQNFDLNKENRVFDELMSVFSHLKKDYERIQELNERLAVDINNFDEIMEELARLSTRYEQEEGYSVEYKVKQILTGLNFPENLWKNVIGDLSGGQQSRIALGKILLEEPELLILDEPTNHLDLNAIEWLEKFLKDYNKAFILISHDRYFLDNVINKVFELERKTINIYRGNFTDYTIQKEAYLTGAIKSYEKEQDKIKKTEEFIRRYKAGVKSKQARGREKILDRMEKMDDPVVSIRKMKLKFQVENVSTDRVVKIRNLSKSFDGQEIFRDVNMEVYRGDRIGLIGKNGVGKSTILRIINSLENKDSGEILWGERIKIGYYDQKHEGLNEDATVIEELLNNYPLSEEQARSICGGFLFSEDDAFKKIKTLSGGEKARVALMRLIMDKPNFLILDEPTNHLDIYSREILESALEEYDGTLIVVSHDRHFLESVVNKIYEITKDGSTLFKGDYEAYKSNSEVNEKDTQGNIDYEEQKKIKNRIGSLERKGQKLEEGIEGLELEKSILEERYHEAGKINNLETLMDIQKELDLIDDKITKTMEEWEAVQEELSEISE
ncbi:ABC-F family ATP-binding cassette domain-containing protein [Ilyobacter polytropus]|uniref:ABC transporter related protein n=1 Tax=Ilyobacter polytropus (strain ATCC 51220 / DSM 2926 / LMG 16218 / CuHBu1) TaxID=572544 RepID=E3H9Q8_ILYPC|nr:ABC-F family ATP-binding cassette domain-containing protein [Ilyobacter polytropus]ADO83587.1 ABC transporter related protein [Ilyobacter polytropus DSM 2926]